MTINVIKHLERGENGTFVETIERKGVEIRISPKKGVRGRPSGSYKVSYKGLIYSTFTLPACYDECAGTCISVDRPIENRAYFANRKRNHEVIDIRYEV